MLGIKTNLTSVGLVGALVTATLVIATPSDAATIIQNASVQDGNSFDLNQFDSSLGTLTSVEILISNLSRLNVANPNPHHDENGAAFTMRAYMDFNSANAGAPALPSFERTVTTTYDTRMSPYELGVGGNQTTTLTSGLDAFIGSSTFNYVANGGLEILNASAPYGATSYAYSGSAIRITYNYNEAVAAVPEPATWALMTTGFGLVGAGLRRRASSRSAAFA